MELKYSLITLLSNSYKFKFGQKYLFLSFLQKKTEEDLLLYTQLVFVFNQRIEKKRILEA